MLGLSLDASNLGGADPRMLMATGAIFMTYLGFKLIGPKRRRPGPYPPGPTGLPVVGNLFQLGKSPHLKFMEWSKKYGKVFSIKLGVHDVIVINGWKAYRQALIYQADSFAGRPNFYTFRNIICDGKTLAFNTYSDRFKQHKKILVEGLKTFLQSNDPPIDQAVLDEAKLVVKHLQNNGEPVEPYTPLLNSCLFVICGLIFGYESDLCKDRAKVNAIGNVDETRDAEGAGSNVVDFFPFIRPLLMGTLKGMLEECNTRMAMIRQLEKEHRETYDENALRDLMDHLIKASDNMNADQKKAGLTSEHIMSTAFTLLNAGSDTLAGMLYWATLYSANYPEVQEKIIAEIDEVIGGDRMPTVEDRPHLPYTEAFLNEVMRYCVLTPFLIPHAATRDVKYMGYTIPEGTVVFCNMWSVSRDDEVWPDPNAFRPERWMDDEGRLNKTSFDNFYPFSAGKRRCIGESMARMEFMMFFVTIMQNCRIENVGDNPPDMTGNFGFSMLPNEFKVLFKKRREASWES